MKYRRLEWTKQMLYNTKYKVKDDDDEELDDDDVGQMAIMKMVGPRIFWLPWAKNWVGAGGGGRSLVVGWDLVVCRCLDSRSWLE